MDDWGYAECHNVYHIDSKGRGAYKNFHASNVALIRILTTVLLFPELIYYRINIFWCWLYQGRGAYMVFKFNRFNNMYHYNCIFFWASRDEKQLFWTPVRLDFLKVLRFSFPLCRRKHFKNLLLPFRAREEFLARSAPGQVYRETSATEAQDCA